MDALGHMAHRLTRFLTRRADPTVRVGSRTVPAFVFFAGLGLVVAAGLTLALALHRGLSPGLMAGLGVAAVAAVGAQAVVLRAVAGAERLVYYRAVAAIGVAAGLVLWLLDRPALPYLEVLLLGVGALQAIGRMGCFRAGCCHGRPHAWGVCYRRAHTAAGLDRHLVGVPLVPVQLVEMGWALGSVALGSVLVVQGAPPGSGLAAYGMAYSAGRFGVEFMRGDAGRPYAGGFSEAQWIALAVATAVVGAGWSGVLPAAGWHLGTWASLLIAAALVALKRSITARHRLMHPRHVGEVARALRTLHAGHAIPRQPGAPPHTIRTSLGVELSSTASGGGAVEHYAARLPRGTGQPGEVRALRGVMQALLMPFASRPPTIEAPRDAGTVVQVRLAAVDS